MRSEYFSTLPCRAALLLAIAGICPPVFSPAASAQSSPHATQAITLSVTTLLTVSELGEAAPTYPSSVKVAVSPQLQISAYGAAGELWLAPRSWTGDADAGADGTTVVRLYPAGNDAASGPNITYNAIPACEACILHAAATYFPNALTQWNDTYNGDGEYPAVIPPGLKLMRLTPRLVTYALPDEKGMLVRGAAFYGPGTGMAYEEIRVTLPLASQSVAAFLVKYFADHAGHDCSLPSVCR